ncbi:hypothetical protein AVEN_144511-1 [Araneus ventricosus]|uniref:Uncharacterized protein n=1 Tax=Araneus ventricosus TaxID=182803 RepID=A0A4Y2LC82_ARAVE|nr:hypothetical protein AVEN_144511-1 [Araneus ventricosus]
MESSQQKSNIPEDKVKILNVMWKVAIFVSGVTAAVLLLALLVTYKNWAYEQELDSLLWKIDYKDIQINEHTPSTNANRVSKNVHPLIRTSQVSLSSNVEGDFRYTTIFTTVGIYKGRMLSVKRFKKKSIDITRKMKKELKVELKHSIKAATHSIAPQMLANSDVT